MITSWEIFSRENFENWNLLPVVHGGGRGCVGCAWLAWRMTLIQKAQVMYVRARASCAEYWVRMVRGVRMVRAVRWGM